MIAQEEHAAPSAAPPRPPWLVLFTAAVLLLITSWPAELRRLGPANTTSSLRPSSKQLGRSARESGDACSGVSRRRRAAAVAPGDALPPVLQLACPRLDQALAAYYHVERRFQRCAPENLTALAESVQRQAGGAGFAELLPCDLARAIQGRTLWLLGDSQMDYMFRHMQCFIEPLLLHDEPVEELLGDPQERGAICVHLPGGGRICKQGSAFGGYTVNTVLPGIVANASSDDLLLVNFGLHHHLDANGSPAGYAELVQNLADYHTANRTELPRLMWLSTSPQHWDTHSYATGEYPDPSNADEELGEVDQRQCVPIRGAYLRADGTLWGDNAEVLAGGWRNAAAKPILEKAGIPYIDIWNASVPLWYGHKSGECTHHCRQMYGLWTWLVYRALDDEG